MTSNTEKFRLLHTMLRVKDLDAALDFYTNKLGMKLLRKTDFPSGEFTLAFVGYGDEEHHSVVELTHNWGRARLRDRHGLRPPCDRRARHLPGLRRARRPGRQDPAPGRPDEARRPPDRLHRGPRRLQDRAGRARVAARPATAVGGLVSSIACWATAGARHRRRPRPSRSARRTRCRSPRTPS